MWRWSPKKSGSSSSLNTTSTGFSFGGMGGVSGGGGGNVQSQDSDGILGTNVWNRFECWGGGEDTCTVTGHSNRLFCVVIIYTNPHMYMYIFYLSCRWLCAILLS